MIHKKVCMVGSFAVGKTSLVQRYVSSIYSEKYHTTLGVKIDKKVVEVDGRFVTLMLWDLAGEDAFHELRTSYVRGASGLILVADGTRPATLDVAISLEERIRGQLGKLPFVLALNKVDLEDDWVVDPTRVAALEADGWPIVSTSAKTGDEVEGLFESLARRLAVF